MGIGVVIVPMDKKSLEEAFDEIEQLYKNPETYHIAMSREFFLKDQMQREEDAREEGRQIATESAVLNMFKQQVAIERIAELVNISIQKVEEIIQSEEMQSRNST